MKKFKTVLSIAFTAIMVAAVLVGCAGPATPAPATQAPATEAPAAEAPATEAPATEAPAPVADEKKIIGVAQCHMNTPYRVALTTELSAAAQAAGYNWEFIFTDGKNDPTTQIDNVQDLIASDVDIVLMAPAQAAPLTPVAGEVLEANIPLVLVDRTITNDDYTSFVGGDNINAGRVVGQWIVDTYGTDKEVIVVEMQGTLGASATIDRHKGFHDVVDQYPNIKVVSDQSGDYVRDTAMALMENILQANDHIDVLYCHSDNMALGAIQAIEAAGRTGEMAVFGTDGQKAAFDAIREGKITGTVFYPTGAAESVDLIAKILNGEPVEKVNMLDTPLILKDNVDEWYDKGF